MCRMRNARSMSWCELIETSIRRGSRNGHMEVGVCISRGGLLLERLRFRHLISFLDIKQGRVVIRSD